MEKSSKIYVAGHRGLAGSAILRRLRKEGYLNLVYKTHRELDLTRQNAVERFFAQERPDYVFLAAAKVGGILANSTSPGDFIYQNLAIQTNVIHASYLHAARKLLFLGSSCVYPKLCPQPIKEEYLLSDYLEPTNEPYAVAKIAGIKMCQAYNRQYGARFISVMPTNLFGPNDHYDLEASHVLPAMFRKFHEAKRERNKVVEIWGTGTPKREFLHVDDLADACIYLMKHYNGREFVNIGTGKDITIRELAELVAKIVGFEGSLSFDVSKPDGTPEKRLDVSKMNALGWRPKIPFEEGVKQAYRWYLDHEVRAAIRHSDNHQH